MVIGKGSYIAAATALRKTFRKMRSQLAVLDRSPKRGGPRRSASLWRNKSNTGPPDSSAPAHLSIEY
jgi:hypothetical protein